MATKKAFIPKVGSHYNYRTPPGTTGRMKITDVIGAPGVGTGQWFVGNDKTTGKTLKLRTSMLSV